MIYGGGRAGKFAINANDKDKTTLGAYIDSGYNGGDSRPLKAVQTFLDLPDDNTSFFYPSLALLMFLAELTDKERNMYFWRLWYAKG